MPWLRMGDTAAMHPKVLGVLELDDADDRLLNEVFGFVARCATLAAAHQTDYVVTLGTARALAGMSRYRELLAAAVAAGLLAETLVPAEDGGDPTRAYMLVQDPELMHMRLRGEVDWDRQRKADIADSTLTGPVRVRDGDACRYCGRSVNWKDRRGRRGGTYDHLEPGKAATVDTLVVSCKGCNSARQDRAEALQLLPVPTRRIIGPETAQWLTVECGIPTEPTYRTREQLTAQAKASVQAAAEHHAEGAEQPARGAVDEPPAAPPAEAPAAPPVELHDVAPALAPTPPNRAEREARDQRTREQTMARLAAARIAQPPGRDEDRPHPPTPEDPPEQAEELGTNADLQVQQVRGIPDLDSSGRDGTGRDGPGRAGAGRDGSGQAGQGSRQTSPPRDQPARARPQPKGSRPKTRRKRRRKGR